MPPVGSAQESTGRVRVPCELGGVGVYAADLLRTNVCLLRPDLSFATNWLFPSHSILQQVSPPVSENRCAPYVSIPCPVRAAFRRVSIIGLLLRSSSVTPYRSPQNRWEPWEPAGVTMAAAARQPGPAMPLSLHSRGTVLVWQRPRLAASPAHVLPSLKRKCHGWGASRNTGSPWLVPFAWFGDP